MKKILGELHLLVILHWTYYATKNESAFEGKTHPLLTSQAYQARPGMTKRAREGSITINDPQSLEVARQVGTRLFTIRIDHFIHVDDVCDFLSGDFVIGSGMKSDAYSVARGPDQLRFPDCLFHTRDGG